MQGSGDKRPHHTPETDADAVFSDFTVPEDADVQTGDSDTERSAQDEDRS